MLEASSCRLVDLGFGCFEVSHFIHECRRDHHVHLDSCEASKPEIGPASPSMRDVNNCIISWNLTFDNFELTVLRKEIRIIMHREAWHPALR